MISVGLIGAGRMGAIRARTIANCGDVRISVVADSDLSRAQRLAAAEGTEATADWPLVIENSRVDAVIIATPTTSHKAIACMAMAAGKHVLCEKPLARTVAEAEAMVLAARQHGRILKTGFNYRYMPHVAKAKQIISAGEIGPVYLLRCRFGHGGRPGFEKEWHTNQELSGGGVLLEQGIHIIDLVRYLLGEPTEVLGEAKRFFWDLEVEDNFFCLLRTEQGQTASLHVSWTQWINTLELEIYGANGYLVLEGRDGNYGPPRLRWAQRRPDHSRPQETVLEYPAGECWGLEWQDFVNAIRTGADFMCSGSDGLAAQRIIDAAYASSKVNRWVAVSEAARRREADLGVPAPAHS